MECPICGFKVANLRGLASHFRHNPDTHPDYKVWSANRKWEGKSEPHDYVTCRECGFKGTTLATHLRTHGLTADQYREKHGQDALIRCEAVTNKRKGAISKARKKYAAKYDGIKQITCQSCGVLFDDHKLSSATTCSKCKEAQAESRWEGLSEPEDYVTCLDCGYRGVSLSSHLQHSCFGYRERHPDALIEALTSKNKTKLIGVVRTQEFKDKVREAKSLNLTAKDFEPFLEDDGTVDHRKAMEVLGVSDRVISIYIKKSGLQLTEKYLANKLRTIDPIPKEVIESCLFKNGKVSLSRLVKKTGYAWITCKKQCIEQGYKTSKHEKQYVCMETLSEALGLPCEMEWSDPAFTNPKTGRRFKYDGFFPDIGLVVEFHGHQHFEFPNAFQRKPEQLEKWLEMMDRDKAKRDHITNSEYSYLEIRFDEPYDDVEYLKALSKRFVS